MIKLRNWFKAQFVMARMGVNWGKPGYDPRVDRDEVKRLWREGHPDR